jgi:PKD repeat protein
LINNKLKAKKQDRQLRELFRHNLENVSIIPDPSVSSKLMRKLAVREFLHFYPFRFNIYYLGGIIAACAATVLLLTSGPEHRDQKQHPETDNQVPSKVKSENVIIPIDQTPEKKGNEGSGKPTSPVRNKPVVLKEAVIVKPTIPVADSSEKFNINPGTVNESLKGKEFFTRESGNNFKLQEMSLSGEPLFESSVNEGCAPLKVSFKSRFTEYDSCLWTFGDGGSSADRDPEWIYDIEGEYKVYYKIFGPGGKISVSSAVISVFSKPSARFEISPDKVLIPEDEVRFMNYSSGAVRYIWNFGDGNTSEQFEPLHRYDKYGNYNISLKVYSEVGCTDSLVVLNAFSGSAYFIEFPNAFIPNTGGPSGGAYSSKSDESAQVFHPSYSGVSEYHLKIFSKLGVLIFETNDINVGWDGYFKGQLNNPGVYIWKVRGNFSNGEPFTKMGDVTLLKNL